MNTELPRGWIKAVLHECAFINMGQSPKGKFVNSEHSGLPFYQGKAEFGKVYPTPRKYCTKPSKIALKNDILLSIRAPVGPTNLCPERSCIGRGLASIKACEGMSQDYLHKYFKNIESWLSDQGTGSTFKAISGGFLKEVEVLVAPLNEQNRIANKLDSLLARVDTAEARLDKIPILLKRFRQSVLKSAISGELIGDSRKYINWEWIKLADVVDKIEAGKNIKCLERPPLEDELGIVKISAVTWGTYDESESKTLLDNSMFKESCRIQVDDFLISRANTIELVGAPVIVDRASKNLMLSDKVLRLAMPDTEKQWVNIFLRSPAGRNEIESRASGNQQSMRNISQKSLLAINLPNPTGGEKKEIVRRVDALFALAESVEKHYHDAKKSLDRLTQAILTKAFRGELVPQDPNDEPASELLKRIQSEKSANQLPLRKARNEPSQIMKSKSQDMKIQDLPDNFLSNLLKNENSGEASAESLWKRSELRIDDFYAQLKLEMNGNRIVEDNPSSDPTMRILRTAID